VSIQVNPFVRYISNCADSLRICAHLCEAILERIRFKLQKEKGFAQIVQIWAMTSTFRERGVQEDFRMDPFVWHFEAAMTQGRFKPSG
jgi:hypothetical protein